MRDKIVIVLIASIFLILCSTLAKAQVTLSVGKTEGYTERDDNKVYVSLSNPHDIIKSMQMDICDVDDYIGCTSCELTNRVIGANASCLVREQPTGCCRIVLIDFTIENIVEEGGAGPILTLTYDVLDNAPIGEYRALNLEKVAVIDENNFDVDATLSSGEVFFGGTIPTLSEWGLIIFMTIVMGIGVVTILRRKMV